MSVFHPKYGIETVKLMCPLFVSLRCLFAQKLSCAKPRALIQGPMGVYLTPLLTAPRRFWWKFLCLRFGF